MLEGKDLAMLAFFWLLGEFYEVIADIDGENLLCAQAQRWKPLSGL